MKNKLQQFKQDILRQLGEVVDISLLQELEKKYLGRKGELTLLLKDIGNLPAEEKKAVGKLANGIRAEIQAKLAAVKQRLGVSQADKFFDATLPGEKIEVGHLHPLTQVQRELEKIFTSMGFMVLDGPELESDYYNFEALNIPADHPARDMHDTFYLKNNPSWVMRTHTSPVQVRAMEKYGAPLRAIDPGRCFRNEATDPRHEHTLYQLEGLVIDRGINFAHLKGIIATVAKHLYGGETKVRFLPKFYPFVEPGVRGEVTCFLCHGTGCRVCKNTGWLEIFGAGMMHPNVLRAGKIDPEKYSGLAFGLGLSRLVMLKYAIPDARYALGGDLRFLNQF